MNEPTYDLSPADLTPGEQRLLAHLAALVHSEQRTPPHVEMAARALHDWVAVDAHLAELARDAVLTRGDDNRHTFTFEQFRLQVDVETAGYRRRRLSVTVQDVRNDHRPDEIRVQFPDGSSRTVTPDRFGDHVADMSAGTLRAIAVFDSRAITTPWFTI